MCENLDKMFKKKRHFDVKRNWKNNNAPLPNLVRCEEIHGSPSVGARCSTKETFIVE